MPKNKDIEVYADDLSQSRLPDRGDEVFDFVSGGLEEQSESPSDDQSDASPSVTAREAMAASRPQEAKLRAKLHRASVHLTLWDNDMLSDLRHVWARASESRTALSLSLMIRECVSLMSIALEGREQPLETSDDLRRFILEYWRGLSEQELEQALTRLSLADDE